jgi:ABC-type dipeptide/oligopeptide/nickel transport system ATPase component
LGINISSSSKFSFDLKTTRLTKKDVNNPLPDDFFGSSIIDVMGIVGKNGVGKSNAIALICKILKSSKTALNSDFVIVTEEDSQLCYYSSFENGAKINVDFDIQEKPYSGNVNKSLKVVFFSNVFDDRRNGFSSGVADISVNRLASRISVYHSKNELTDFEKQVRLIDSKIFPELNIDLPNKVNIVTRVWLDSYGPSSIERSMPIELYDSFSVFNRTLRDRIRKIEPIGKFISLVKFSIFIDFVRLVFKETRFLKIDNSQGC